jgi:hypothetical protein
MREASRPPHTIARADGERVRLQRDTETEMINVEIRARRAAET